MAQGGAPPPADAPAASPAPAHPASDAAPMHDSHALGTLLRAAEVLAGSESRADEDARGAVLPPARAASAPDPASWLPSGAMRHRRDAGSSKALPQQAARASRKRRGVASSDSDAEPPTPKRQLLQRLKQLPGWAPLQSGALQAQLLQLLQLLQRQQAVQAPAALPGASLAHLHRASALAPPGAPVASALGPSQRSASWGGGLHLLSGGSGSSPPSAPTPGSPQTLASLLQQIGMRGRAASTNAPQAQLVTQHAAAAAAAGAAAQSAATPAGFGSSGGSLGSRTSDAPAAAQPLQRSSSGAPAPSPHSAAVLAVALRAVLDGLPADEARQLRDARAFLSSFQPSGAPPGA